MDIYICQYKFISSIICLNMQIDQHATLRISNFTIIDSIILNSSALELFMSYSMIVIHNVKIINVTADNAIIRLDSSFM